MTSKLDAVPPDLPPPTHATDSPQSPSEPPAPIRHHVNIFFRLAALFVTVFIVTIFSLISILFGDPQAPVTRWLDQHGTTLILGELALILLTGTLAMTVDQKNQIARRPPRPPSEELH